MAGLLAVLTAVLLGGGVALLAWELLRRLVVFLEVLWLRRRRRLLLLVRTRGEEVGASLGVSLEGVYMLAPAVILAVAALRMVHLLVTPALAAAAAGVVIFSLWRVRRRSVLEEAQHAALLVHGFRSIFLLERSLTQALEQAAQSLPAGEARRLALQVVSRYRAGMSLESSLEPLRRAHQPYLRQLCLVLERVEKAEEGAIVEALDALERQLGRQRRLRARARAAFALTSGTLRALQGANAAVLLWAAFNPIWQDFFLSTPSRALLFSLCAGGAAVAGMVFDVLILDQEAKSV